MTDSADTSIAKHDLGPDALDPAFDEKAFAAALGDRGQPMKTVLIDQTRIAGIANIYADEILFQARVHPGAVAGRLDTDARPAVTAGVAAPR